MWDVFPGLASRVWDTKVIGVEPNQLKVDLIDAGKDQY